MNKINFEKTILWTKRPSIEQIRNIKDVQRIKEITKVSLFK